MLKISTSRLLDEQQISLFGLSSFSLTSAQMVQSIRLLKSFRVSMRLITLSNDSSRRIGSYFQAIFIFLTFVSLTVTQQTCYWPNKTPVNKVFEYLPCGDGNSTCCSIYEACISNGLCYGANNMMVKNFLAILCPKVLSLTRFHRHTGAPAQIQIG